MGHWLWLLAGAGVALALFGLALGRLLVRLDRRDHAGMRNRRRGHEPNDEGDPERLDTDEPSAPLDDITPPGAQC